MEGDAGASQLNPTDADGSSEQVAAEAADATVTEALPDPASETAIASAQRRSRLGRGWLIGICAVLLVLTTGVATAGYFALRAHDDSQDTAHVEAAALQAAKNCVS